MPDRNPRFDSPKRSPESSDRVFPGQSSVSPKKKKNPTAPVAARSSTGETRGPETRGFEEGGGGFGSYKGNPQAK